MKGAATAMGMKSGYEPTRQELIKAYTIGIDTLIDILFIKPAGNIGAGKVELYIDIKRECEGLLSLDESKLIRLVSVVNYAYMRRFITASALWNNMIDFLSTHDSELLPLLADENSKDSILLLHFVHRLLSVVFECPIFPLDHPPVRDLHYWKHEQGKNVYCFYSNPEYEPYLTIQVNKFAPKEAVLKEVGRILSAEQSEIEESAPRIHRNITPNKSRSIKTKLGVWDNRLGIYEKRQVKTNKQVTESVYGTSPGENSFDSGKSKVSQEYAKAEGMIIAALQQDFPPDDVNIKNLLKSSLYKEFCAITDLFKAKSFSVIV